MTSNAVIGADYKDAIIQNLQHALGFRGKIDMPGRVKKSDRQIIICKFSLFGKNCDPAFPLLIRGIKEGVP